MVVSIFEVCVMLGSYGSDCRCTANDGAVRGTAEMHAGIQSNRSSVACRIHILCEFCLKSQQQIAHHDHDSSTQNTRPMRQLAHHAPPLSDASLDRSAKYSIPDSARRFVASRGRLLVAGTCLSGERARCEIARSWQTSIPWQLFRSGSNIPRQQCAGWLDTTCVIKRYALDNLESSQHIKKLPV